MEVLGRISIEPDERVVNSTGHDGSPRSTTCIDTIIDDGLNQYLCSQWDVRKEQFPKKGDYVRAEIRFTARKTERDGVTRWFQSIRITAINKV